MSVSFLFSTARLLLPVVFALLISASASPAQDAKDDKPPRKPFDVFSAAVTPDGKTVAAGGGLWDQPGEVGVWELETGRPVARFAERLGVGSVAFSPDGKLLASGSWSGHVRLRDWAAGVEVADFDHPGVARVAFSPDGKLLATATEKSTCQLWDVAGRRLAADLDGDLMRFHCVIFSPDGKKLLAGGGDWKPRGFNQVTIWDVESKRQVGKLVGHDNAIIGIVYSPDGKTIATGGVDTTIRLWDAETAAERKVLRGHRHWVENLAFTADGKTLVSGSHDHTVRFWDVDTGNEKARLDALPGSSRVVLFTPDFSRLIVGGGMKTLRVLDAATREERAVLWNQDLSAAMERFPLTVPRAAPPAEVAGEAAPESHWNVWLGLILVLTAAGIAALLLLFVRRGRGTPASAQPAAPIPADRAVKCTHCQTTLRVKAALAGRKVKCPRCAQVVAVPG